MIKIDRRLISGVPGDRTADAVIDAIIGLAGACGAEIIAEGVETDEQLDFLARHGIELVQGYLFGHPGSVPETTELLARRLLDRKPTG